MNKKTVKPTAKATNKPNNPLSQKAWMKDYTETNTTLIALLGGTDSGSLANNLRLFMEMEEKRHEGVEKNLHTHIDGYKNEIEGLTQRNRVLAETVQSRNGEIHRISDEMVRSPETKQEAIEALEKALSNISFIEATDILYEALMIRKQSIEESHWNITKLRAHIETICKNLQ